MHIKKLDGKLCIKLSCLVKETRFKSEILQPKYFGLVLNLDINCILLYRHILRLLSANTFSVSKKVILLTTLLTIRYIAELPNEAPLLRTSQFFESWRL